MSSTLRHASLVLACVAAVAAGSAGAQTRFHLRDGAGPRAAGLGGGYTTLSNGNLTHQGAHYFQGNHGASYAGHNNMTRNADGSASSNRNFQGTTAFGGNYSGNGSYSRNANGVLTGNSQASGSGPRGSYNVSNASANGVTTHDTTATNAATGITYNGQTTYTKGQGFTHSGSCTNASGATVACGL
jgi:hypothetical protein